MKLFRDIGIFSAVFLAIGLVNDPVKAQQSQPFTLPSERPFSLHALPRPFRTNPLFPQHVLENPMGYSPLCRMELKIEEKSPVGVWMRLDGNRVSSTASPGWAYLRVKVPLRNR
jgi:hypothetical protein